MSIVSKWEGGGGGGGGGDNHPHTVLAAESWAELRMTQLKLMVSKAF
jgi:hypothetical protein